MKILQVIDSLKVGGAQKLLVEFTRELSGWDHSLNILVLSCSETESPLYQELYNLGVPLEWLPFRNIIDVCAVNLLKEKLVAQKPDIVHTQLNYANIHGALAAARANLPVVSSLHNASVHLYGYRPYRTWFETWALRRWSARIIACGYTVARVQQHRFPHKKLDVIPNPVPEQPEISTEQVQEIRRQYLQNSKGTLIVSVGRLIPEKGFDDLIKAIEIIKEKSKHSVKLLIVGKGYLMDDLEKQVKELQLSDYVNLLGERNDVPALLAASDIFASSSHYEGQSLAVLEAMNSGLPVIVTEVGDNRRVVAENCGVVLPAGAPGLMAREIVRLIDDPRQRKAIGKSAQKHVRENYSVSKWTDSLLDLYSEVLHG